MDLLKLHTMWLSEGCVLAFFGLDAEALSGSYGAVYGRMRPDAPAPTITTGFTSPGRGRFIHPTERRTITPREAALIQGFPGNYRFVTEAGGLPTRTQLAKWIGDAVPMPLGYAAALAALGQSAHR